MTTTQTTTPTQDFVRLSALLTGFAPDVIAPALDETDLKTLFFSTASSGAGAAFDALLTSFTALEGQGPQTAAPVLLGLAPDPATGAVLPADQVATAKAVMKLWYLGSWYQPFDLNGISAGTETVVSSQAYVKGLAWQVMQSHAMGNSTFTFGYWAQPPAGSLQDFTGNPETENANG